MSNAPAYTTIDRCRVCGCTGLTPLFSLGNQYVSDFVTREDVYTRPRAPIDLVLCTDCSLTQQRHTVPQDFLYTRFYWYRSSVTSTMRDALKDLVRGAEACVDLHPGDIVLDIGANDGTLLSFYPRGVTKVGCEPAENLYRACKQHCDYLVYDFWSADAYFDEVGRNRVDGGKAKIITAAGMVYDLPDPNPFIADVAKALAPDGVFVAQLMCAKNMLALGDVGNLCHEHLEFYPLFSLNHLLAQNGLEIFDVETNAVNGESYRVFARHRDASVERPGCHTRVAEAVDAEDAMKLHTPDPWQRFYARAVANREECIDYVHSAITLGKRVWVYGASTKGNVFLQWANLDHRLIEAAADRSPEKVGLFTAGTGIPIRSEEDFRAANPDFALVLPYSFREEFLARESAWRSRGGRFLFPLPQFEVV